MDPDLPSDSDASDEDYRPSGEESGAPSEDDSDSDDNLEDNNDELQQENCQTLKGNKSKKGVKRKSYKRKRLDKEINVEPSDGDGDDEKNTVPPEEEKKKADLIWAEFLKDCDEPLKKKQKENSGSSNNVVGSSNSKDCDETETNGSKVVRTDEKENKKTVTEIFEFAGETVRVEKQVSTDVTSDKSTNGTPREVSTSGRGRGRGRGRGGSALTSFLGQIGKKGKLSVLEKSKLDWDGFKKSEGIEEDISKHNKGKDGYLERQDFLQRTDLRRFEIEKAFRQKRSGR